MALSKILPASQEQYAGARNIIINGNMACSQRGSSETGVTSSGYFSAPDRWRLAGSTSGTFGTWSVSQSTDIPSGEGFAKSYKLECTTADASLAAGDNLTLQHRIEGQNLQQLSKGTSNAKTLTLSFWVKSNKTGTYIAELRDQDNTRVYDQQYTISASNTWEKKTLTYAGDTTGSLDNDNLDSLRVLFFLLCGTDFTSGTLPNSWASSIDANRAVGQVNLADTVGNEWYITGVQLEVGEATPFEHEPFAETLHKCQRYYQKSYLYGNTAGTVTNNGALWTNIIRNASNQNYWQVRLNQEMRTNVSVTTYSPTSGVSGKFRNATDNATNDSAVSNTGSSGFSIRPNSGSGQALGEVIGVHWVADAEL